MNLEEGGWIQIKLKFVHYSILNLKFILRLVKEEDEDPETEWIFDDHQSSYLQLDTNIHRRHNDLPKKLGIKFLWDLDTYGVADAKDRNEVNPVEIFHKWGEERKEWLKIKLETTDTLNNSQCSDNVPLPVPTPPSSTLSHSPNEYLQPSPPKRSRPSQDHPSWGISSMVRYELP